MFVFRIELSLWLLQVGLLNKYKSRKKTWNQLKNRILHSFVQIGYWEKYVCRWNVFLPKCSVQLDKNKAPNNIDSEAISYAGELIHWMVTNKLNRHSTSILNHQFPDNNCNYSCKMIKTYGKYQVLNIKMILLVQNHSTSTPYRLLRSVFYVKSLCLRSLKEKTQLLMIVNESTEFFVIFIMYTKAIIIIE